MQLTRRGAATTLFCVVAFGVAPAKADSGAEVTGTVYHEGKGKGSLHMTVVTPSAGAHVDAGKHATVHAEWEADVVSGASVAVVDAPSSAVDVITSATKLKDIRHNVGGGLVIRDDHTSLDLSYHYGFEKDYRSHAFALHGKAELFDRDTTLELSYARGFDRVCDLAQPNAQEAVDRQRLPSSDGCFSAADRVSHPVDLHTLQAAWTQAWTPIFVTQLTVTSQVIHGFQSNPYRGVFLGLAAAQEHEPNLRIRYAGGLSGKIWIQPLRGSLQLFGRLYRDTWDVRSVTAELAYEQSIAAGLRIRARGRYYLQSGAIFYSDNYALFPHGQYFTGDRELSPMSSWTVGGSVNWTVPTGKDGEILGFIKSLAIVGKADFIQFTFSDFHYGEVAVPNNKAIVATLGIEAVF